jgi:serine/threonine protein kinase
MYTLSIDDFCSSFLDPLPEIIDRIRNCTPPLIGSQYSEDLKEIISSMLEKNPPSRIRPEKVLEKSMLKNMNPKSFGASE